MQTSQSPDSFGRTGSTREPSNENLVIAKRKPRKLHANPDIDLHTVVVPGHSTFFTQFSKCVFRFPPVPFMMTYPCPDIIPHHSQPSGPPVSYMTRKFMSHLALSSLAMDQLVSSSPHFVSLQQFHLYFTSLPCPNPSFAMFPVPGLPRHVPLPRTRHHFS